MNTDPVSQTIFVTALPAEAKPVRRHFRLERDNRFRERPVYRRANLMLVISGTGRQAAWDTVRWCRTSGLAAAEDIWINLGIGGHQTHNLGQAVLADEVVESSTGKRWICNASHTPLWVTGRVVTLAAPEFDYRNGAVYDMEAAGFLEAVEQYGSLRHAYCLKVVSDNAIHGIDEINGQRVSRLLGDTLPALEHLLQRAESQR